jgi:hypothetical protein
MSNLLEKASIITTPTAYSDGKLHSVKPVQTLGNELVTNGDFENGSTGWILSTQSSIVNGQLVIDALDGSFQYARQNVVTIVGNTYKVEFDIIEINDIGEFQLVFQNVVIGLSEYTSVGTYTLYFESVNQFGAIELKRKFTSNTKVTIDNVSVKEVTDADFDFQRGSAATRVNSQGLIENVQTLSGNLVQNGDFSEIGSEEVTNGGFDTNLNNWTAYSNTLISWESGGYALLNSNNNYWCKIKQSNVFEIGKTYKIILTAKSNRTDLSFHGSPIVGNFSQANTFETFEQYYTATTTTFIFGYANAGNATITIDNVSVKEVGQNWTITGDKWDIYQGYAELISNDSVGSSIIPNTTIVAVSKYRCSFDAVVNSGSCKFQSSSGITYQVIDETKTYNFIFTSDSSSAYFNRLSAISNITLTNISIIEITDDTDLPRIDYTDGCGSLLLEPQSTNLLLDSGFNDVSSTVAIGYWYKSPNASISENSVIGVDGLQSAATYTYNGGTTSEVIYGYQIAVTSGVTYTVSGYVKLGTAANFVIVLNNTIWWNTIPNGNFVATAVDGYDNWKRFEITFVAPSTNKVNVHLGYHQENGVAAQTNGSVFIDSFQVEQQSYPTSYIPTNGSTATRLADVCNNAGSSDLINSTEGVLYAEISKLSSVGDGIIGLFGNSTSLQLRLEIVGSIIKAQLFNGSFQANMSSTQVVTDNNKIAFKYKENDFALWINGVEVATDNSGVTFNANELIKFNLTAQNDMSVPFYGNVKSVAVYKEALTNDELEGLTGEGYDTFNALALANNYTII